MDGWTLFCSAIFLMFVYTNLTVGVRSFRRNHDQEAEAMAEQERAIAYRVSTSREQAAS